jgi:LPXTG-motif cell wall-anchored protein
MKKLMSMLLALMLVFSSAVYAEDQSIVDIAVGNEDFSILVAALQKAELVGALQGEGPFTVFAPNNAAFLKLLEGLGITAEQLLDHPQLSEILLYHVVSAKVMSTDLSDGLKAPSLNGEELVFYLKSGVKVSGSAVTAADIEASNGVIHVIDTVMVPTNFVYQPMMEMETTSAPVLPATGSASQLTPMIGFGIMALGGLLLSRKKY